MKKILNVTEDYHDMRIDRWVKKKIFNVPQSLIEKSLRQGKIKVNNLIVKSSNKLKYKDKIYLYNFNPETAFLNKKKYVPTKKEINSSESFSIDESALNNLEYNSITEWDSVGHMSMIGSLEEAFNITLEMDDIIDFSSYEFGKKILKKYKVKI